MALYKTIILELLQDRPDLYENLRSSKRLLTALDSYAGELKTSHESLKEAMSRRHQGLDPSQMASEALELAIEELTSRLDSSPPLPEAEPLSLDAAMAFLRRPMPNAS